MNPPEQHRSKANILLVNDRPDKLLALGALLEPLRHNLVCANSGDEALRRLLRQDFAVILLDVMMPDMDGFETATFIRQRRRSERTPIIFVTSIGSAEEHVARGYSLGAVDYLLEPFSPEALRSKVMVFVELFQQTAEIRRLNGELERRIARMSRLNSELEERTVKLRETLHELEGFSYSITHDMRAPLRAMQGYVTLLEEECSGCDHPPSKEYTHRIKSAARRMDRLIQDALDYSKALCERLPLQPVEVGGLLREMVQTYPNLQSPGAEISIEFESLEVLGNEAGLTQCFSNLLGNAVKFVQPGVRPRVRVWAERGRGLPKASPCAAQVGPRPPATDAKPALDSACQSRIWFEDNGIGIPAEAHERIFVMFQRLHGEDEYPGTGIGLALVAKTVQRMGGKVGVLSVVGQGSRFWIELPAPEPSQSE